MIDGAAFGEDDAGGGEHRGDELTLTVLAGDRRRTLTLAVGAPRAPASAIGEAMPALAGAEFANARGRIEGVAVAGVASGSPAWRFGLRAGDVIVGVNRERVRGLEDLRGLVRAGTRVVVLDVVRDGRRLLLARP